VIQPQPHEKRNYNPGGFTNFENTNEAYANAINFAI